MEPLLCATFSSTDHSAEPSQVLCSFSHCSCHPRPNGSKFKFLMRSPTSAPPPAISISNCQLYSSTPRAKQPRSHPLTPTNSGFNSTFSPFPPLQPCSKPSPPLPDLQPLRDLGKSPDFKYHLSIHGSFQMSTSNPDPPLRFMCILSASCSSLRESY